MTKHIESAIAERPPSLWKKLYTLYGALARAMDYDPHEVSIKYLKAEIEQLKARLAKVESFNPETARRHDVT